MFDEENLMSQPMKIPYFFRNLVFFRIISVFFAKFLPCFFAKFSHSSFLIISGNFCILYFAKISHFSRNRLKQNFAKSWANEMQKRPKFSRTFFSAKKMKLSRKDFSFSLRTLVDQGYNSRQVNCSCVYSAYILKPVLSGRNL